MEPVDWVDWAGWERLLRGRGVVIDRPRGSAHPRYPDMIYPLDYGYIPNTTGGDGAEVDVFVGAADNSGPRATLETAGAVKGDRELKLLWNVTGQEIVLALHFLSRAGKRVKLRLRPDAPFDQSSEGDDDGG
jgi:inorganic pyrophosphatase